MFYIYYKVAFNIKVKRAESINSKLYIFELVYNYYIGLLYPFLDKLILDTNNKKALLSFFIY